MSILEKYNARVNAVNSLVCVGLDSDAARLPQQFLKESEPQYAFNRWVIDQTYPYTAAYKINSAFYEARGDQGWHELKLTTDYLRQQYPNIVVICDAKRGDNSNTNTAYVTAIFDELGFDAVTLHPYLGQEALQPFLSRADKAVIILCRTSNSGAGEVQDLQIEGKPLWQIIAEKVSREWNTRNNCMLVVGATYPEEMRRIRDVVGDMTFLVPGVGVQGGDVQEIVDAGINDMGTSLIINASRSIIFSDSPGFTAKSLQDEINLARHTHLHQP